MDLPSTSSATNQINAQVPLVREVCKIELTPSIPNPHYLKQCYLALCERKELVVPPDVLKAILKTSCNIPFDKLDETLQNVLVDMLQYLLLVWPLWPSLHNAVDKAEVHQMYSTFLSYIRQHLTDVVANEKMYREQVKVDKSTDTRDLSKTKEVAPFEIVVSGPAYVQSSVMFTVKEDTDDIVLASVATRSFPKLTLEQLLNWLHISVYVDFMDVAFVRRNVHVLKRFLCKLSASDHITNNDDANMLAAYRRPDIGNSSAQDVSVHYELFNSYLLELWKRVDMYANPKPADIIAKVFEQFSKDVEEAHTPDDMVTVGTSVCFNIGGQMYTRNRTYVRENQHSAEKRAYLYEEIIPKVEYTLLKFNAQREETHPYGYIIPDKNLVNSSRCIITFTCQFCNATFEGLHGWDMIQQHMEKEHTHEYCVYCYKCNRNYGLRELAANRWKHDCRRQ